MPKRNELAPYHVHLRDEERRLLNSTLYATGGNFEEAAAALGIGVRYMKARIKQLGGVLGTDDRHEPPLPIWSKVTKE